MPNKKTCYFSCTNYEGPLYGFPPMTYTSYERFCKWKNILSRKDREKEDYYIFQNYKLCCNHFEKHYLFANRRLTRHAVPTIKNGIAIQQEELLCSFLEENSALLFGQEMEGEVIDKWKTIGAELNALGPQKNYSAWAEYLHDIMSNLKTKQVIWTKQTSDLDTDLIKNSENFCDLELKILQVWHMRETTAQDSSGQLEINLEDENGEEYMIEVEHDDNSDDDSGDGVDFDTSIPWTNTDIQSEKEVVTFTLNEATGGKEPLLQAAELAPYEAPNSSDIKCNCNNSNGLTQDEFDDFGKDIAQRLRSMPRSIALETQQLLTTVLRNRQIKILNFNNYSFLRH